MSSVRNKKRRTNRCHRLRSKMRHIVEDTHTLYGRIFDASIQFFIVLSLISFSLETLPDLTTTQRSILRWSEIISVIIFTLELICRVWVSRKGWRYLSSAYGLIDIAAMLPFYLSLGVDLRSVRALRFLRIFRLLKLARFSRAIQRYHQAFRSVMPELIIFGIMAVVILFISATGIYYFEGTVQPETFGSIPASLWWAVETLSTVGYGDAYPITVGGKVFTFFVVMIGLGVVAVPSGIMASSLSRVHQEEKEKREKREKLRRRQGKKVAMNGRHSPQK